MCRKVSISMISHADIKPVTPITQNAREPNRIYKRNDTTIAVDVIYTLLSIICLDVIIHFLAKRLEAYGRSDAKTRGAECYMLFAI